MNRCEKEDSMPDPSRYLTIHQKRVAAIQTPEKYSSEWKSIAEALPKLVRNDGFHYLQSKIPDTIRRNLTGVKSLAKALRAAAKAEGGLLSKPSDNARARALLLKTLAHLYFFDQGGGRKLWILSTPSALRAHPIEYRASGDAAVDQLLELKTEIYSDE